MYRKKSNFYLWFVIILCIFNLLIRLPFSNYPAIAYDEPVYLDAVRIIASNHLNPFIEFWGYKPPSMFMIPALFASILPASRIYARLEIYALSSLALFFTFLLGKKLFSQQAGLFATLMLFLSPLFIAQSFTFQDSIPLTAALVATLYFYFAQQKISYLISCTLLVLTKEPAIIIPLLIFLYDGGRQINKKRRIILLAPLLPFSLWLIINKHFFGWFLLPQNTSIYSLPRILSHLLDPTSFTLTFQNTFILYGQWIIFLIIIFGVVRENRMQTGKSNSTLPSVTGFFLIIILLYYLFFTVGAYLPRYVLFVYPLAYLLCAATIEKLFLNWKKTLYTIIIGSLFISNAYHALFAQIPSLGWYKDIDLSFFRSVALRQKAILYVQRYYPDATILADWPLVQGWTDPYYGFVQQGATAYHVNSDKDVFRRDTDLSETRGPTLLLIESPVKITEKFIASLRKIALIHNNGPRWMYDDTITIYLIQ